MSERASQMCAVVSAIDPAATAVGTSTGDVIDASLYDSILFILSVGNVSSSTATIKLKVYEGTATATVTTAIGTVSLTAAGTGGSDVQNKQYLYDLDCAILTGPTYRYVKPTVVTATKDSIYALTAIGFKPRFHPASDSDVASVGSITVAT